jgi:hypothetical protein
MSNDAVLFVEVPKDLKIALAKLAVKDQRSLSGEVRYLLAQQVAEKR